MPKTYGAHETQFILNLKEYFKRERANGGPLIPINALNEVILFLILNFITQHKIEKKKCYYAIKF